METTQHERVSEQAAWHGAISDTLKLSARIDRLEQRMTALEGRLKKALSSLDAAKIEKAVTQRVIAELARRIAK